MKKYTWRTLILEAVMIVLALLFLSPIYILIVTAFKSPDSTSSVFALPSPLTLSNFTNAWRTANLFSAIVDSAIITVGSVVVLVVTSSLAAYPLARITARWSKRAYYGFIFGFMLPIQLSLIPLYVAMQKLGLTGGLAPLIFVYAGVQTPFCIFLYTEFLRSVPRDYDEAASIDGATRLRVFIRILFPLLRPITGTVIVLNGVLIWNDFYIPLLYLSGSSRQTLTLSIFNFVGLYTTQWNLIFAALIIGAVPILAAFLLMQKAVFRGYMSGLKG